MPNHPVPYGVYTVGTKAGLYQMHGQFEQVENTEPINILVLYKVEQSNEWYQVVMLSVSWAEARVICEQVLETSATDLCLIITMANTIMVRLPPQPPSAMITS